MSLASRRARVEEAERALDTHAAETRRHGGQLRARLHAAWPWLWVGGGATLGIVAEQRMAESTAGAASPANAGGPSTASSLLASVPWGLLIALVDHAMMLAHRDADLDRQSAEAKAKGPAATSAVDAVDH